MVVSAIVVSAIAVVCCTVIVVLLKHSPRWNRRGYFKITYYLDHTVVVWVEIPLLQKSLHQFHECNFLLRCIIWDALEVSLVVFQFAIVLSPEHVTLGKIAQCVLDMLVHFFLFFVSSFEEVWDKVDGQWEDYRWILLCGYWVQCLEKRIQV